MNDYLPHAVPLYGPDFTADPWAVYERLRAFGPLAPVEIAPGVSAYLVTDHRAALDLLHDTTTWSKDPRAWQQTVPADCPVLPLMAWRANALYNDGETHARYRRAIDDTLSMIEPHALRAEVLEVADTLIRSFAAEGTADLVTQYAAQLPVRVFNRLFGMTDEESERLIGPLATMVEATDPVRAVEAGALVNRLMTELIEHKRRSPGQDIISWFLGHPAGLTSEEVLEQAVLFLATGNETTSALLSNALSRMVSDERYYSTLSSGALAPLDALRDVLRNDPPVANLAPHFARRAVHFHGTWIQDGQLVLVSFAAAGTTPDGPASFQRSDGGAHLAWSAGPHACPAKNPALLIAMSAIERLTSHLCDLELTVSRGELTWRPGMVQRALAHLPVRFTSVSSDRRGVSPWSTGSGPRERG
ncbi:cytochrome P450 [Streptomyces gardneri]|uniref:cytochrome P450 n=1 Tax=Streptomyces gardneri TaxID=66892 RepID=UPI00369E7FC2